MTDEDSTNRGKSEDIPMQVNPTSDKDTSASSDKPPKPLARDYDTEKEPNITDAAEYASVNKRKKLGSFPTRPEFVYKPENPEAWMSCIRNILIVINLFIWLFGAVITAVGVWIKVDDDFLAIQTNLDLKQFTSASIVLIIAGIVIMLVGFIGCYGVIASQVCVLIIFSIIVLIVILLEIAIMAIVWTAVSNKNAQEDIKQKAVTAMHKMLEDPNKQYFINLIQSKLKCCGVNAPSDYTMDPNNPKDIPDSCISGETGKPYQEGCYNVLVEYIKNKAAVVGGVAVAIFLLQLGVLLFTVCFMCGIKNSATSAVF